MKVVELYFVDDLIKSHFVAEIEAQISTAKIETKLVLTMTSRRCCQHTMLCVVPTCQHAMLYGV